MGIVQLNTTGWAMTYLVWDESTNEAALIDPVYDFIDLYTEALKDRGLKLTLAMATHTHADHITACFVLREKFNCEYLMWHGTSCLGVSQYVEDREVLTIGATDFTFHHAPGHTSDSMMIEQAGPQMTGAFHFTGA